LRSASVEETAPMGVPARAAAWPFPFLVASLIVAAGCHGFATGYRVSAATTEGISSSAERERAIELATRFAERHGFVRTGSREELARARLGDEGTLLAQFSADACPAPGGGCAGLYLSVSVAPDTSVIRVVLLDVDNRYELDYVRKLREELGRDLEAAFGRTRVVMYQGKAGAPFVAP
jgi:hypothetical protein